MKPSLFIQTLDLFKTYLLTVSFWTGQLTRPDQRCFELVTIRRWLAADRDRAAAHTLKYYKGLASHSNSEARRMFTSVAFAAALHTYTFDATAAVARVDRVTVATAAQTLPAAMQEGYRLLETVPGQRHEMYVFTDCSQGAWEGRTAADLVKAHADTAVMWVDVGARAAQNFTRESLDMTTDQPTTGGALGCACHLPVIE
jgi:hypothetical protein